MATNPLARLLGALTSRPPPPPPPALARLLGALTSRPPPPALACPPGVQPAILAAAWVMLAAALATAAALLLGPPAPYGRHNEAGNPAAARCGPGLDARWAWFVQELPAFAVPAAMAARAARKLGGWARLPAALGPQRAALLAAFLTHYAHRALIYPWRIAGGRPTPVGIASLAFSFCLYNGLMQGAWLVWCGAGGPPLQPSASPLTFRLGMAAWAAGAALNTAADASLRRLRRGRPPGSYALPTGPLFRLVACPNYLGEALEWAGWAAASGWRLPATAFAVYTLANLAPRARAHAAWYAARFPGQFDGRRVKAIVPFVY
jgi:hypothetical protein